MSLSTELAGICKDLKSLGDQYLANKALVAFAAVTDSESPMVDLSYSYIMRKLRKGDDDIRKKFQSVFKEAFDRCLLEDVDEPAEVALMVAIKAIDYKDKEDGA